MEIPKRTPSLQSTGSNGSNGSRLLLVGTPSEAGHCSSCSITKSCTAQSRLCRQTSKSISLRHTV